MASQAKSVIALECIQSYYKSYVSKKNHRRETKEIKTNNFV